MLYYYFSRSGRGAQTWYPFGPATRARARVIFNLSQNDIYEEILDSLFYF